ncbi:hypothetical protein [Deinococcus hohokamensis]|uniref:Uncharacterized protein n=1 Tax=Deinococcus hohokamensis TaxID=309883 RepID=A0ABV9ID47_9DEIO
MSRALILCLLALVPSCAPRVLSAPGWQTTLRGTRVSVRLVDAREFGYCSDRLVGCTVPVGRDCLVLLDRQYFLNGTPRQKTLLLAHEVGHCLDGSHLAYSHGGFGDAGKIYGPYYAAPVEGFAEGYARAYLDACGTNLAPLGWGVGEKCPLPDPRQVRPPAPPLPGSLPE